MNAILFALGQPWGERLGWALIHFVWQGALLAALYAIAARLAGANPVRRYLLACVALAAMAISVPATCLWLSGRSGAVWSSGLPLASASAPGAVTAPPAADAWQQVLPWLVMAWFVGVMAFSMRLAGGWLQTAWWRRVKSRPAPSEWQNVLDRLVARMRIDRRVRLAISPGVEAPAVLGWLRPMILMPVGALTGLPAEFVEALLSHELAHILRRDYLVNLLQCLAEAVLFYHPAVWWISAQIRHERELCCDDLAVAASDVLTYTRALADLESHRAVRPQTAMAANGGSLLHRISRLLGQKQPARHTLPDNAAAWVLGILLMAAIGAIAVRGAHAQEATVSRDSIWMDTVRLSDMNRAVRGLGVVKDASTVELRVAETQMKDVKAGQAVRLATLHNGPTFTGVVTSFQNEPTKGTQGVQVHIPNAAPVPQGTQVDGIIEIEHLSNVLNVGRPVFANANNKVTIFKLEPDGKQAVRVVVQFGRTSVNVIEVRSGLQPGDKVILSDMAKYDGLDRITLK